MLQRSAATLGIALLAASAAFCYGQDDPFAEAGSPFDAATDSSVSTSPFDSASPFGAPQAGAGAVADPFAAAPAAAAPAAAAPAAAAGEAAPAPVAGDPFAAAAGDPFAGDAAAVADPFAAGGSSPFAAPSGAPAVADPFAAPAAASPFGAAPAPAAAAAAPFSGDGPSTDPFAAEVAVDDDEGYYDPFASIAGGGTAAPDPAAAAPAAAAAAPAPADPFGGAGGASPFGGPAAGPAGASPFGDTAAAPAPAGASPFGDTAAAPAPAGASPFGAPGSAEPFGAPPTEAAAAPAPEGASPFGGIFASPAEEATPGAETSTGGGITTLYAFRYVEVPRVIGTTVVARQRMTWDEAMAFDEARKKDLEDRVVEGDYTAFQPGVASSAHWAEWLHYAEQLDRWRRYVADTLLVESGVEADSFAFTWPGERFYAENPNQSGGAGGAQGAGGAGAPGSPNAARPSQRGTGRNIHNENRSLDDQMQDFNPFAESATATEDGREVHDPKLMNDQAVAMYRELITLLREQESKQEQFLRGLARTLRQRELTREAYANWRTAQMESIVEYVGEWERQYEGRVTTIAGVRYELYNPDDVPGFVTRGANVVITDFDLTPYDILNADGTLRGPAR